MPSPGSDKSYEEVTDKYSEFTTLAAELSGKKTDWGTIKDSMVQWLKTNVGGNVDTALNNLDDLIIKAAADTAYEARDYLKDAKRHLQSLSKNSETVLTTHNSPPREDANDGVGKSVVEIVGWRNPVTEQTSNDSSDTPSDSSGT